jgi:endonuclease/exonuclease/phosphatase family metal-dependent hydrolase
MESSTPPERAEQESPAAPSRAGRIATWALWVVAGLLASWTVVRLLGLEAGYPLVPLMAFTPYIAIVALIVAIVAGALRELLAGSVALIAFIVLAVIVLPRAFSNGVSAPPDGVPLKVMTANLELGEADPDGLVELVREEEPDVLAVQELTPDATEGLRGAGLLEELPERRLPEPGASGNGLYSRHSLRGAGAEATSSAGFLVPRATIRVPGGGTVEVVSVHAAPPRAGEVDEWESDLRSLPSATPGEMLRVLAGDFNATLDHAELRDVLDSGYEDAADADGAALTPTWPVGRVIPPPLTVDHVLADERIAVEGVSVHDLPGSDHKAVSAELVLPAAP